MTFVARTREVAPTVLSRMSSMSAAETATVIVKTPRISKTLAMPPATAVSCAAVIDTGGTATLEAATKAVLTGAFDKRFVISVEV